MYKVAGLRGAVSRWMQSPSTNHRSPVWNAVGMMMAYAGEPSRDALARLREYAFSHDLSLDDSTSVVAAPLRTDRPCGRGGPDRIGR
jgi:hypothetical protein